MTHADSSTRLQAVEHNLECIEIGRQLGSNALTVWIADGSNFPGQTNLNAAFDRYMDSLRIIYDALPKDWYVFLEHKLYEPAFYATVISDWGSSFMAALELGPRARCLVDLGHHAPNTNIEQIVARLIRAGKLAGFHFNDSKYGDDDLDSGSIDPFRLFLVFNELVDAEMRQVAGFSPAYMIDQSHNVTDPIESLMASAVEIQRAFVQASLIDREVLEAAQDGSDVMLGHRIVKQAFITDVSPILAMPWPGRTLLSGMLLEAGSSFGGTPGTLSGLRPPRSPDRMAMSGRASGPLGWACGASVFTFPAFGPLHCGAVHICPDGSAPA